MLYSQTNTFGIARNTRQRRRGKRPTKATGTGTTGFFKTFVSIENPSGTTPLTHLDYPSLIRTCCRKVVQEDMSEPDAGQAPFQKHSRLTLVPNPASNRVQLEWSGSKARFEVVDALGRKVVLPQNLNESSYMNTAGWPVGLYYVRVMNETGVESHPLQIIR